MKLMIFKIVMKNVFHLIQVGFVMILHSSHIILEQKTLYFLKQESNFDNFLFYYFLTKKTKHITTKEMLLPSVIQFN